MMVDRFNNPAAPPHHQPWDHPWGDYQGGTFAGIQQQLDYLQELGVGALWLSPLLKNCQFSPSYHGYGFQNFLAIEPRFSSNPERAHHDPQFVEGELRELVDEAHARNIYVIFDIVLHHVGDVFAYPNFGSVAPWNDHPYPILWCDEQGNPNAAWPEASSIPTCLSMLLCGHANSRGTAFSSVRAMPSLALRSFPRVTSIRSKPW
jgi:glycosidase